MKKSLNLRQLIKHIKMKKLFLGLLATVFTLSMYSCRETNEKNIETNVEEVDTNLDDAGDDIESGLEEAGNEINEAGNEVEEEIRGTDDI